MLYSEKQTRNLKMTSKKTPECKISNPKKRVNFHNNALLEKKKKQTKNLKVARKKP